MWTQGDVQAAIDRELTTLDRLKLQELPGLLERLRAIGEKHEQGLLADRAIERVRAMLPPSLRPAVPAQRDAAPVLKKCDACGFEWKASDSPYEGDAQPCVQCRMLVIQNRLQSLGVYNDDEKWIGKIALALCGTRGPGRQAALGFEQQFDSSEMCGCLDVVSRPQTVFRPQLLVVAPDCGDGVIVDIKVGNRSQTVAPYPVALSLYKPSAWADVEAMRQAMFLQCDKAVVAQDISLVVSLRERGLFRAALIGVVE